MRQEEKEGCAARLVSVLTMAALLCAVVIFTVLVETGQVMLGVVAAAAGLLAWRAARFLYKKL